MRWIYAADAPGAPGPKNLQKASLQAASVPPEQLLLGSMGHTHKWQFDEVQLIELFESQGFVSVVRMPYHQSRISDVAAVERSNFLIVEGVKPEEVMGTPNQALQQPAGA